MLIRPPAVAGTFYPGAPTELAEAVDRLLASARSDARRPKAIIVPHAGYVYSGAIAAAGFAQLAGASLERIVLIGPAHRVAIEGLVWPGVTRLATPLGELEVDLEALARVPEVVPHPAAHAREHSLEVELPFLQHVAPHAKIVPIAASHAAPRVVGGVLEALWGGDETAIVISSDLSHFHGYDEARQIDRETAQHIVALDPTLSGDQACGCTGINGLLWVARPRGMRAEILELCNSGDTAGRREEVVGYGAFALYEAAA